MSDTSPKNQRALQANAPRPVTKTPQPGERLFEFLRGHDRFLCELRDHGETYGVEEAQFYQNEEFLISRRFDCTMSRTQTLRALVVQWAVEERKAIETRVGSGDR